MAAFGGYFDTGGAEHQGHFVVPVGVVASVQQWDEFDVRWLEVLRKFEIGSFHMWQIAHWAGDIGRWPLLADGKRDEARRKQFLSELVRVAAGSVQHVFVRGIALGDYKVWDASHRLTEVVGGAYCLGQAMCLLHAGSWLRERNDPSTNPQWRAIVELGDAGQDRFRKFCEMYLTWIPTFTGKQDESGEDITPLSLADLIAYEHQVVYNQAGRLGRMPSKDTWRGLLRAIRESFPVDAKIVDRKYLNWFCTNLRVPLREPAADK